MQAAVEVNQWKYRASNNSSFECEFFYNGGDLDSGVIMSQFMHVLNSCELMNCHVLGFVSDGNSKNVVIEKLLSLAKTEPPESLSWLDDSYVSMVNPCHPSRRIFFWLCSTHQLKAL